MRPLTVDIPECTKLIGVRRTTLYSLIRQGLLQKVKIGRRTLITMESVDALVAASKAGPES